MNKEQHIHYAYQMMHDAFCNELDYCTENQEAGPYGKPKSNVIKFKTKGNDSEPCEFEITQTFRYGDIEYRAIISNPQLIGLIIIETEDFRYFFERLKALVLLFSDENICFV